MSTLPKVCSLKDAVNFSIVIWRIIIANPGKCKEEILPGIMEEWAGGCPLCELYNGIRLEGGDYCAQCPLKSKELCGGGDENSAYNRWLDSHYNPRYAEMILDALVKFKKKMEVAERW